MKATVASSGRHVLVIHSAGSLAYLDRLRPQGFRFTLVKKRPTDQDLVSFDRVVDWDYQVGVEPTLALVDRLCAEDPVHGVLSFSESGVIMAAIAAEHLGLPGNPSRAALRARDKVLMRHALRRAGLDSPPFCRVRSAAEVVRQLRRHRQPMVLKPISGSSSYGVTRLEPTDPVDRIEAHLAALRRYIAEYRDHNPQYPFEFWLPPAGHGIPASEVHDPGRVFLLEGFIGGQQVSVDGFVSRGRVTTCGVIEIERIKGSPYFLEYEEWMPTRFPAAAERRVEAVAERAVQALGLQNGPFHCELKISDEGIFVLEVAARRGADNIGDFLDRVMGVDIYEEAVRIACGQARHRGRLRPRCHMRMRYFLPEAAGQLIAVEGAEEVRRDPRVSELVLEFAPGDEILVPPDGFEFLGYVSVCGATAADAAATLEEVHGRVRFLVLPPDRAAGTAAGTAAATSAVPQTAP